MSDDPKPGQVYDLGRNVYAEYSAGGIVRLTAAKDGRIIAGLTLDDPAAQARLAALLTYAAHERTATK